VIAPVEALNENTLFRVTVVLYRLIDVNVPTAYMVFPQGSS
jgi:hypothetical protein